jgi:hypothetical protein
MPSLGKIQVKRKKMAVNLLVATDSRLVKMVRDKADNGAFLEVCRRYENIFYKVCQKYSAVLSNNGVNPQDIYEEKNFIIFHCISSFKPCKKAKLGTWIGNYARYLCLNSINARKFILPTTDDILKSFFSSKKERAISYYKQTLTINNKNIDFCLIIENNQLNYDTA